MAIDHHRGNTCAAYPTKVLPDYLVYELSLFMAIDDFWFSRLNTPPSHLSQAPRLERPACRHT
jgi:hypothetical protein